MREQRLVRVTEAAAYCSLSPSGFRAWINRIGLKSKVKCANLYDMNALDAAIDRLSGINSKPIITENDQAFFLRELKKANKDAILVTKHQQNHKA
jgi:hypothetical protein